jgi:hypothetical protein
MNWIWLVDPNPPSWQLVLSSSGVTWMGGVVILMMMIWVMGWSPLMKENGSDPWFHRMILMGPQ